MSYINMSSLWSYVFSIIIISCIQFCVTVGAQSIKKAYRNIILFVFTIRTPLLAGSQAGGGTKLHLEGVVKM